MKLAAFELRRAALPLVSPFRTSFGTESTRDALLVRALSDEVEGWGECVAGSAPLYSAEHVDGATEVIRRFLAPRLFAAGAVPAEEVAHVLASVKGHPMAKAAVETAILDAELRAEGRSLAAYLGAVRPTVECGVSVGIQPSIGALLDT
ncbi:MAG: o-succinylbenzoate synthase, partial [Acidimicrobiales bacterium]